MLSEGATRQHVSLITSLSNTNYKRNAGLGCLSLGRKECQGISQGQAFIIVPYLLKDKGRVSKIGFVFVFALFHAKTTPINMGDRQ